jgi:hypothetical protein
MFEDELPSHRMQCSMELYSPLAMVEIVPLSTTNVYFKLFDFCS